MLKQRRNASPAPPRACALSLCVRYLSGRWTPNILWFLGAHPRRFTELKKDLAGVSAKVLAQRLKRLQSDGLVSRAIIPTSPPSVEYALTDLGRTLLPALETLVLVGERIKLNKRAAILAPWMQSQTSPTSAA